MIGYIFNILRKIANTYQTSWWKPWTHTCKFRWYFASLLRPAGLDIMSEQGPMIAQVSVVSDGGGCQQYRLQVVGFLLSILVSQTYRWSCSCWSCSTLFLQSLAARIAFWTESASTSKSRRKSTNLLFHLPARIPNTHFEDLWNRLTHLQQSNLASPGRSWCHRCRNVAISMRAPSTNFWLMTKACSSFWSGAPSADCGFVWRGKTAPNLSVNVIFHLQMSNFGGIPLWRTHVFVVNILWTLVMNRLPPLLSHQLTLAQLTQSDDNCAVRTILRTHHVSQSIIVDYISHCIYLSVSIPICLFYSMKFPH